MNPPPHNLSDDLLTRWIDGQLTPEETARVEGQLAAAPELLQDKRAAGQLGELLRKHLPAKLEPPSPEFFTSSIIGEILTERSPAPPKPAAGRLPAWPRWIREPWFAPVASAAVVAIGFVIWNHRPAPPTGEFVAQTYAPDPKVVANAFFSEEAQAIVIDLQNLDAVPDNQQIRAFDVASAGPPAPGEPLVLFAASEPARPVLVLSRDLRDAPRVTVVR